MVNGVVRVYEIGVEAAPFVPSVAADKKEALPAPAEPETPVEGAAEPATPVETAKPKHGKK